MEQANSEKPVKSQQLMSEPKRYEIKVVDREFKPSYLRVKKGAIVEWKVYADSKEQDSNSLYFQKSRSHVISFNEIYIESPKLELPGY